MLKIIKNIVHSPDADKMLRATSKPMNRRDFFKIGSAIAAGTLFAACEHRSKELTKTFTFGPGHWSEIYPVTNIAAAGRNNDVAKIIIGSNGQSFNGMSSASLIPTLFNAFAAADNKGTGNNTLISGLGLDGPDAEQHRQWLLQRNFRVERQYG